jgi:hypothetical protein
MHEEQAYPMEDQEDLLHFQKIHMVVAVVFIADLIA